MIIFHAIQYSYSFYCRLYDFINPFDFEHACAKRGVLLRNASHQEHSVSVSEIYAATHLSSVYATK